MNGRFPIEIFSTNKTLDIAPNCGVISNLIIFYGCYFYSLACAVRLLLQNYIIRFRVVSGFIRFITFIKMMQELLKME